MTLRHAVLAALLDGEYSGYELTKRFDTGVANFWHARPQQVYAELAKLERDELVTGRTVRQEVRPTKRLFSVTDAGIAEMSDFAAAAGKPSFIRDDLLVKVQASDHIDAAPVLAQLRERAELAQVKVDLFTKLLLHMRGDRNEEAFLRNGSAVGPYLTCLRGLSLEREHREWCLRAAEVLRRRGVGND